MRTMLWHQVLLLVGALAVFTSLRAAAAEQPNILFLFADDPGYGGLGEKNDLAASQPDKVKELQLLWVQWNAQLAAPSVPKDKALRKEKKKKKRNT